MTTIKQQIEEILNGANLRDQDKHTHSHVDDILALFRSTLESLKMEEDECEHNVKMNRCSVCKFEDSAWERFRTINETNTRIDSLLNELK